MISQKVFHGPSGTDLYVALASFTSAGAQHMAARATAADSEPTAKEALITPSPAAKWKRMECDPRPRARANWAVAKSSEVARACR